MTIAEMSKTCGLSSDTLRYYEHIGVIPPVGRTKGGMRDYSEADCRWVFFVKCMRSTGMPVGKIAEYVRLCMEGDSTVPERIALLRAQREQVERQLEDMHAVHDTLNAKIENYENQLLCVEQSLADAKAPQIT